MSEPVVLSAIADNTSAANLSLDTVDSNGTGYDRPGRSSQLRPSRLSRSKSRDRKGRLSSSSGVAPSQTKPPRSTRRVTAAQKKWGNSSLPSMSVLGSIPAKGHGYKAETDDRESLVQAGLKETHGGQRNQGLTDEESEGGGIEPPEDDDIFSDQDEELTKSFSSLALRGGEVEEAECRSSHPRSSSRRRPSSRRSLHADEGLAGSTLSTTSTRSKRRTRADSDVKDPSRQRARSRSMSTRSNGRSASTRRRPSDRSYRDKEDENASGGSTKSSRRRPSRRDESDSDVKDPSSQRTRSRSQSTRSKGRSTSTRLRPSDRSQRVKEDDSASVGSTRSSYRRSSRRDESGDDRSLSTKLRPSELRRPSSDDDDQSARSGKSISRRYRQQGSRRTQKASSSQVVASLPSTSNSSELVVEQEKDRDQAFALAKHLRSNPKKGEDEEEQSGSYNSTNCEHPAALVQFDPANANHFTLVRQDSKAVVKCERFKHPDGTESELRIREFKKQNLPTFASPPAELHASSHTSAAIDYASDDEVHGRGKRSSMSNLASMMTPNLGRRGVNESGLRRGVTKSISTDSTPRPSSRKDRDHKNQLASPWASASFQNSVKDFMGRWNKSGETPSIDEDLDESPGASRLFHKVQDNSAGNLIPDGN